MQQRAYLPPPSFAALKKQLSPHLPQNLLQNRDTDSTVVMELEEPSPGSTVLKLTQRDVPEADKFGNEDVLATVERGWRGQVFGRIRQVFGYQ